MNNIFCIFILFIWSVTSQAFVSTMRSSHPVGVGQVISVDYKMESRASGAQIEDFQRLIGSMFYPDSTISVVKKINQKVYVDTTYETNAFGLRKLKTSLQNEKAKKHFVLAGDSFIFGDGNTDEETLVAKLSEKLPAYQLLNFGYISGAPNYTLSLMENYPWSQEILPGSKGIFVFYFNPETQMQWVIGSLQVMKMSLGAGPYYKLNWKGDLERIGNFNDRFFWSSFYKWLNQFSWFQQGSRDYPRPGSRDAALVAKMFSRMKALYLEQFPGSHFVVAMKASYKPVSKAYAEKLSQELLNERIDVVHLQERAGAPGTTILPRFDFHPNGKGNSLVASELIEKLRFVMEQ